VCVLLVFYTSSIYDFHLILLSFIGSLVGVGARRKMAEVLKRIRLGPSRSNKIGPCDASPSGMGL
jgi:hypothetical protein